MSLCLVILHYCEHTAKTVFVYPFSVEKCWNKNLEKSRTVSPTCINFKHQSYHLLCSGALFFFLFTYLYTCYCKIYCCQKLIFVLVYCIICPRLGHSCKATTLLCLSSLGQDFRLNFGLLPVWRDEDTIVLDVQLLLNYQMPWGYSAEMPYPVLLINNLGLSFDSNS